ncbi:hypothetical protein KA405_04810 [Patescibacteria group bacterium]|nr:hypothetical protein [Patescibacteria group bacterium]
MKIRAKMTLIIHCLALSIFSSSPTAVTIPNPYHAIKNIARKKANAFNIDNIKSASVFALSATALHFSDHSKSQSTAQRLSNFVRIRHARKNIKAHKIIYNRLIFAFAIPSGLSALIIN